MPKPTRPTRVSRRVAPLSTRSGARTSYPSSFVKVGENRPATGIIKKVGKPWQARVAGSPSMIISVLLHLLFFGGAAYLIVSSYTKERKIEFSAAPLASSDVDREFTHLKVIAKKRVMLASTDQIQTISTSFLDSMPIPEIDLPAFGSSSSTTAMASLVQPDTKVDIQALPHMELESAAPPTPFGSTDLNVQGLEGKFYSLREIKDGEPSNLDNTSFMQLVTDYVNQGFTDDFFKKFWVAPKPLYATQFMIPFSPAGAGPTAFGQPQIPGSFWVVVYKGRFKVPHSGIFRFVGSSDTILEVSLDGKHVLDASKSGCLKSTRDLDQNDSYSYNFPCDPRIQRSGRMDYGYACGLWMNLKSDQVYELRILLAETQNQFCMFNLLVEEQNHNYITVGASNAPVLIPFRLSGAVIPDVDIGLAPYDKKTDLGWTLVNPADQ